MYFRVRLLFIVLARVRTKATSTSILYEVLQCPIFPNEKCLDKLKNIFSFSREI